jgi:hypothetical protein
MPYEMLTIAQSLPNDKECAQSMPYELADDRVIPAE